MTLTQVNLSTVEARLTSRRFICTCELCGQRAGAYRVYRVEGVRVITATVCRECKAVWDVQQKGAA